MITGLSLTRITVSFPSSSTTTLLLSLLIPISCIAADNNNKHNNHYPGHSNSFMDSPVFVFSKQGVYIPKERTEW